MNSDKFEKVVEELTEAFDDIGLYMTMVQVNVLASDEILEMFNKDAINEEQVEALGADLVVSVNFTIGSVAWSDRVLDPDSYSLKKEFEKIAPLEEEISAQEIIDLLADDDWDIEDD